MARPLTERLDWMENLGHRNFRYTDLDAQQNGTSAPRVSRQRAALAIIIGAAVGWTVGRAARGQEGEVATLAGPSEDSTFLLQERFPQLNVVETVRSAVTESVIVVTNDYMLSSENGLNLYPWEHVAEPRKRTALELKNWPETLMSDFTIR